MPARFQYPLAALALLTASGIATAPTAAQSWPTKPVRLLSGFPPGGGSDIVGRAIAQRLSPRWGQSVIVDNRPGAGGTTAMVTTARAAPDGYTLMMLSGSQITNATLFTKMPFDMLQALAPVTQLTSQAYLLLAHPSVPATSVQALIQLAQAKPEQLNFASSGNGSVTHLGLELLSLLAGVRFIHVPYKGSGQVLTELVGGQVQLALATTISAKTQVQAGRVRALASTGVRRLSAFPQLPTVTESGVPGYEVTGWYGIVAPAGTPRGIVEFLNRELVTVLAEPALQHTLANDGAEPVGNSSAAFGAVMVNEVGKWSRVVKARNIRVD